MSQYIQEAFKKFNLLEEEDFNLDTPGVEDLKSLMDDEDIYDFEDVIDPEAETEEELEDSYVGKVILECKVCHSKIYKDASDVHIDEETELANVDEECPFCYAMDGYGIIGQVAPYQETEVTVDVEPKEDEVEVEETEEESSVDESLTEKKEDVCPECGKNPCECKEEVSEGLENLDIETEHDTIHVEAHEKEDEGEEVIAPIEPAQEVDIMTDSEEMPVEEVPAEGELESDIEDFSEEEFNSMGESYLKKVYENVNSFKTSSVKQEGNFLVVEGLINFKSGKNKKTTFKFESKDTFNGKVRFIGENLQICKGKKAFTLIGSLNESKFTPTSFRYNYRVNGNRVYGTVVSESLNEANLSDQEGTASNIMSQKDVMAKLNDCKSAQDVKDLVNSILPEKKKNEPKVKKLLMNLDRANRLEKAQSMFTNFILKGDNLGVIK